MLTARTDVYRGGLRGYGPIEALLFKATIKQPEAIIVPNQDRQAVDGFALGLSHQWPETPGCADQCESSALLTLGPGVVEVLTCCLLQGWYLVHGSMN